MLPHLNLLWELVITAEPLVVMATSPTTAANMVQTLVRLVEWHFSMSNMKIILIKKNCLLEMYVGVHRHLTPEKELYYN